MSLVRTSLFLQQHLEQHLYDWWLVHCYSHETAQTSSNPSILHNTLQQKAPLYSDSRLHYVVAARHYVPRHKDSHQRFTELVSLLAACEMGFYWFENYSAGQMLSDKLIFSFKWIWVIGFLCWCHELKANYKKNIVKKRNANITLMLFFLEFQFNSNLIQSLNSTISATDFVYSIWRIVDGGRCTRVLSTVKRRERCLFQCNSTIALTIQQYHLTTL